MICPLAFTLAVAMLADATPPDSRPTDDRPTDRAATFRVMSFNIRYDNPADGPDAWPHRRDWVAELIDDSADLVGCQEVLARQLADLRERLPALTWEGVGRSDGKAAGEFCPIGYRPERFERIDGGTFWLSDTPEVPGSVGWDAQLPRIATWVRLTDRRTGRRLLAINIHFDHRGPQAREKSAMLLRNWIARHADGDATVLTGDFNATPDSIPYHRLTAAAPATEPADAAAPLTDTRLTDARLKVATPTGPAGTWNGFRAIDPAQRIDYLFLSGPITAMSFETLTATRPDGRFPSDHLPITATLRFTTD